MDDARSPQMPFKILNTADISSFPDVLRPLEEIGQVDSLQMDKAGLLKIIGNYDAYFGALTPAIDSDVINHGQRLKAVTTLTTGLDHIDTSALKAAGIELLSLKEEIEFLDSITATAEMTWALLLSVVRMLPWSFSNVQQGNWKRENFRGRQISGSTLGILGYGRLGKMVAEYGKAFRMRVLVCDSKTIEPPAGITVVDMPTLLRESDVLSIHIHLTEGNRGLLGQNELDSMKSGAILLNTSRAEIVDEDALLQNLRSGHLGGAGLDVLHQEWKRPVLEQPLVKYSLENRNVVISPHTGGLTLDSQRMTTEFMANKLASFLRQLPSSQS
jgi:D-3-phosphoglycerate dehydrogenase